MASQPAMLQNAAVGELLQFRRPLPALQSPSSPATRLFCQGHDHGILCCYFALPFVGTMTPRDANPTEFARYRRFAPASHSPALLGGFDR
jgi:hypothetical protein